MARRLILFGAFDRHNFGDLLLARCAAAGRPGREPVHAGLAARDLTAWGGPRVRALAEVLAAHGGDEADFVHVGGELLTTTAWEAAVMLQTPVEAARVVAAHDRHPAQRRAWAEAVLGSPRRLPYVVSAGELPPGWTVEFDAVGGVGFERLAPAERAEGVAALRAARRLSVRDVRTQAALAAAGVAAALRPDPAEATARLFGAAIARHAATGEVAALARRHSRWLAVQLAAQRGDDATLDALAARLSRYAGRLGAACVLFRAGLAPWHDDLDVLARLADRLRGTPAAVFESAGLFDLCALLAGARGYLGTSLHGWIVAHSFGVPGRCLVDGPGDKAAAYVDTWQRPGRCWRTL